MSRPTVDLVATVAKRLAQHGVDFRAWDAEAAARYLLRSEREFVQFDFTTTIAAVTRWQRGQ